MSWVSAILGFLKALPELIKIFRAIWDEIAKASNAAEKKKRGKELGEAIEKAKREKDTSGLDEWFGVRRVPDNPTGGGEVQKPPSGA